MEAVGAINPAEHFDTPLWCVYGPDCNPMFICCKVVNQPTYGPTIWGYSVYKNTPGFRTIGQTIKGYFEDMEKRFGWDPNPQFFLNQEAALDYLRLLTTPKVS